MISSVAEMARWNIALMEGHVIDPSFVKMMSSPAVAVTKSNLYAGCMYAMGLNVCERPNYRFYQHDGVVSGFMASNAVAREGNGSWMGVTVLANSDATVQIVRLVRNIIEIGN
jgi:hypothetical protein